MYNNLKAEMARIGLTNEKISKAVSMNPSTFSRKCGRENGFKVIEALKIRDTFFPGMTIDYLFGYEKGESNHE